MPLFYRLDGLGKDSARVAGRLEALRRALQTHLAPTGRGSVFDYFDLICRNEDYDAYIPAMMDGKAEDDPGNPLAYDTNGNVRSEKQRRAYYRNHWRRQMSDHLAMWLELRIDYGEDYLQKRKSDS